MTRLTNTLRLEITNRAALKSGLVAAVAHVENKRFDWAERLRVYLLGGPEKAAYYAKLNADATTLHGSLPQGLAEGYRAVNRERKFYVNLAGANLIVELTRYAEAFDRRQTVTADNPLVQQFYDLEHELAAAQDDLAKLRQQVRATLDSFTTIAALVKAWPEATELVAGLVPAPKYQLPAVPVANLNKLIGLPGGAQ